MVEPYYRDDHVTLYHGDMSQVLQDMGDQADAVVTDPPYGETSLRWDKWPNSWPLILTWHTRSMWCFGSLRMFTDRWKDFTQSGWRLSQDIIGEFQIDTMVWEKHNGSSFQADRFKRVHELAAHFYQGAWSDTYHEPVREPTGIQRGRGGGGSHSCTASPTTSCRALAAGTATTPECPDSYCLCGHPNHLTCPEPNSLLGMTIERGPEFPEVSP